MCRSFFNKDRQLEKPKNQNKSSSRREIVYLLGTEWLTCIQPAYQRGRNQPLPPHCVMLPVALPWHLTLTVKLFLLRHSPFHPSITIKVPLLIVFMAPPIDVQFPGLIVPHWIISRTCWKGWHCFFFRGSQKLNPVDFWWLFFYSEWKATASWAVLKFGTHIEALLVSHSNELICVSWVTNITTLVKEDNLEVFSIDIVNILACNAL